jgi:hypothetical protein
MIKKAILVMMSAALIFSCSPSEKANSKTSEGGTPAGQAAGGNLSIAYTMTVSGIPMMSNITFNQQYTTDGAAARVDMESLIPMGDTTRTSRFSTVIDLDKKVVLYLNDVSKIYASIPIPASSSVPPSTSPQLSIEVKPLSETKVIAGVECKGVDVSFAIPIKTADKEATTRMTGKFWVSDSFVGYDAFNSFKARAISEIADKRMQPGGFLDFLQRFGMSRDNLDSFYTKLGGFPFAGDVSLAINEGLPNTFNMGLTLQVQDVKSDKIDKSRFAVPEGYTPAEVSQVMSGQ